MTPIPPPLAQDASWVFLSPTIGKGLVHTSGPGGPLVSVIIPTLNAAAILPGCLQSIRNQSHKEIEVVVVDGGSHDCTAEVAQKNGVRLIREALGRSSARLRGAKESRGRYVLFLDADQRADSDVVRQCVALCESQGLVAVKIPEKDQGEGIWARCRSLERQIATTDELIYPRFYSRSTYFDLGGHAEGLEDYMEDRDLYLRLRESMHRWGQCEGSIINDTGRVNPILLGLKGERAARDAGVYYKRNIERGENIWVLIRPRFNSLLRNFDLLRRNLFPAILMPFYITTAYGPRLVRAYLGRRQATGNRKPQGHYSPSN